MRPIAAPGAARRLLVVAYNFPPDGSIGGLRWAGISKYIGRLGWEVAVVTAARPVRGDGILAAHVEWCPRFWTLVDGYRALRRVGGRWRRSSTNGSRAAQPSGPPGALRHLYRELTSVLTLPDASRGWILRATLRARALIRRFQPQVVVSSGPPHSAHLVAGLATIGSSARWFIDLRDPWAGPFAKAWEPHPESPWMSSALLPRLERLTFRAAQGVITNTPQLAQTLRDRYGDLAVACIPNGVDADRLPARSQAPYPGLGIAYAGTLYGSRDLRPVVRALRTFLDRHPEAGQAGSKLRVAGHATDAHAGRLGDAVAAAGLERHVDVLGPVSREQALTVVSRSQLAVVLAQAQELQIPGKLYESVAMGVPTLVLAEPGSAAGVEGHRIGAAVCDPSDVEAIAGVFERLWQNDHRGTWACPVPITYEAIAPIVARLFEETGVRTRA